MIEVEVQGISLDLNNTPVLLLREREGRRVLPIWVGPFEASSITYAVKGKAFERPLTIDVIKRIIDALGAKTERVTITGMKDSTYFATLLLSRENSLITIDIRPSDAVAIAVHTRVPIFVEDELMNSQGREIEQSEKDKLNELKNWIQGTDPEKFGDFKL